MNKPAIATILAAAALGIAKKTSGSLNQGMIVTSLDELKRHANDPKLAPLVTQADIMVYQLTEIPKEIFNLKNLKINDEVNVELDIFSKYIYKYSNWYAKK